MGKFAIPTVSLLEQRSEEYGVLHSTKKNSVLCLQVNLSAVSKDGMSL